SNHLLQNAVRSCTPYTSIEIVDFDGRVVAKEGVRAGSIDGRETIPLQPSRRLAARSVERLHGSLVQLDERARVELRRAWVSAASPLPAPPSAILRSLRRTDPTSSCAEPFTRSARNATRRGNGRVRLRMKSRSLTRS